MAKSDKTVVVAAFSGLALVVLLIVSIEGTRHYRTYAAAQEAIRVQQEAIRVQRESDDKYRVLLARGQVREALARNEFRRVSLEATSRAAAWEEDEAERQAKAERVRRKVAENNWILPGDPDRDEVIAERLRILALPENQEAEAEYRRELAESTRKYRAERKRENEKMLTGESEFDADEFISNEYMQEYSKDLIDELEE